MHCWLFLKKKEIRINFIGDRSLFPAALASVCQQLEQETKNYTKLQVNSMFCYGGQEEMVSAVRDIVDEVQKGKLTREHITLQLFRSFLWTKDIPDPELIIRTGNQQRLSNFLLFQAAHSELYFFDCLWPDITNTHLEEALAYYNHCTRNFGV